MGGRGGGGGMGSPSMERTKQMVGVGFPSVWWTKQMVGVGFPSVWWTKQMGWGWGSVQAYKERNKCQQDKISNEESLTCLWSWETSDLSMAFSCSRRWTRSSTLFCFSSPSLSLAALTFWKTRTKHRHIISDLIPMTHKKVKCFINCKTSALCSTKS